MQTIILGKRSYISKNLSENIKNSKIYSLVEFIDMYKKHYYNKNINSMGGIINFLSNEHQTK